MQVFCIIEKLLFLVIRLAKYRCGNPACAVKVFCEPIEDSAQKKQSYGMVIIDLDCGDEKHQDCAALPGRRMDPFPYQSVRRYIRKLTEEKAQEILNEDGVTKIRRQDILKFFFDWSYKCACDDHLDIMVSRYPAIEKFLRFYREFRQNRTELDPVALVNQFSSSHEAPCLKRFIDSFRKDWEEVLNAASYAIGNGNAEGTVDRIKQIKRDKFGRAGIDLLRKKIMYQYHPNAVV